jgi:hypothetical protein
MSAAEQSSNCAHEQREPMSGVDGFVSITLDESTQSRGFENAA